MTPPEVSRSIFVDYASPEGPQTTLSESGEFIDAVTSATAIGRDVSGTAYYIKPQNEDGREVKQLAFLQAAGIPVPEQILVSADGERFATRESGTPLHLVSQNGTPADRLQLMHKVGTYLRHMHERLNADPAAEDVLMPAYSSSAHIVDCFFYKYAGIASGVTPGSYTSHKQGGLGNAVHAPLPAAGEFIAVPVAAHHGLEDLLTVANTSAADFLQRLAPYVVRYGQDAARYVAIADKDICYGDFKPENILIGGDDREVRVIDPVLTKGSRYFDLAKFVSRHVIDGMLSDTTSLQPFFEGYGWQPDTDEKLYGPYNFTDLVAVDAINILRSYANRYAAGGSDYRLTAALELPEFCAAYAAFLTRLTAGGDIISP